MKTWIKPTTTSGFPVWQLPVKEDLINGKPDYVDSRTKFHCFVEGTSLCKKYFQVTDFYETEIESGEIATRPEIACKTCRDRWIREFGIIG